MLTTIDEKECALKIKETLLGTWYLQAMVALTPIRLD